MIQVCVSTFDPRAVYCQQGPDGKVTRGETINSRKKQSKKVLILLAGPNWGRAFHCHRTPVSEPIEMKKMISRCFWCTQLHLVIVRTFLMILDDFGDFGGFFMILWSGASASPDLDNNYIGRYNWFFQSKWLFSELRWSCESVRMIYRVGNPGRTNLRVLRELSDHSGKRFCHYIGFCSLCPTDIIMTYTSSLTFLLTLCGPP